MKTNFLARTAFALAAVTLSAACSPPSPKLTAPPEVIAPDDENGGDLKVDFNPMVDILFVIDNSASMSDDQANLANNIDTFVEAFSKNGLIDYHIGIVTVSDRIRQQPGSPNYYPPGQLRPLKIPGQAPVNKLNKDKSCTTTDTIVGATDPKPGFITRETQDGLKVLAESLKVGVQCLEDGGPEYEELFSPVASAIKPEMLEGPNKGFLRDDAHLAVVIVSDALPSNVEITPGELALELRRLKNFNSAKVSTHAIGIHPDYKCDASSPVDPGVKDSDGSPLYPERIQRFVSETGGRMLNICPYKMLAGGKYKVEPWGPKIADIGNDIRRRTLGRDIRLGAIPELGTIKVTYGSAQTIHPDSANKRGWRYNEKTNSVIIDGDVELKPEPGAEIKVEFRPVNIYNLRNGRAQRVE